MNLKAAARAVCTALEAGLAAATWLLFRPSVETQSLLQSLDRATLELSAIIAVQSRTSRCSGERPVIRDIPRRQSSPGSLDVTPCEPGGRCLTRKDLNSQFLDRERLRLLAGFSDVSQFLLEANLLLEQALQGEDAADWRACQFQLGGVQTAYDLLHRRVFGSSPNTLPSDQGLKAFARGLRRAVHRLEVGLLCAEQVRSKPWRLRVAQFRVQWKWFRFFLLSRAPRTPVTHLSVRALPRPSAALIAPLDELAFKVLVHAPKSLVDAELYAFYLWRAVRTMVPARSRRAIEESFIADEASLSSYSGDEPPPSRPSYEVTTLESFSVGPPRRLNDVSGFESLAAKIDSAINARTRSPTSPPSSPRVPPISRVVGLDDDLKSALQFELEQRLAAPRDSFLVED